MKVNRFAIVGERMVVLTLITASAFLYQLLLAGCVVFNPFTQILKELQTVESKVLEYFVESLFMIIK